MPVTTREVQRRDSCFNVRMPPPDVTDPTRLPGWESLPADVQKIFASVRLPSSFMEHDEGAKFVVGPDLTQMDVPPLGRLVRFGRSITGSFGGDFCVNPASGEVFLVMAEIPPIFVNSSLDLMVRTIEIALEFEQPFTTGDAEECWAAYEEFWDAVEQIDPPALTAYWGDFAADAQAGDFSDNPNFSDPYD